MPHLDYLFDPRRECERVALDPLPFVIGRGADSHFVVSNPVVSARHVEFVIREGELWLRDLASRNGTRVNGRRVTEHRLSDGDIIHVATSEFRFSVGQSHVNTELLNTPGTDMLREAVPPSVLYGRPMLEEMIRTEAVRCVFQPIVEMTRGRTVAYEALGRGCFPQLSTRPADLFRLASSCRLCVELSQAFRKAAGRDAARNVPSGSTLFCNLHPDEFPALSPATIDQFVATLPKVGGDGIVILEVHEDAVADIAQLRWLRKELKDRGIGLAYDDFGAGQSRLTELAEVPPDYVKLDMRLVRDIDRSLARSQTVRAVCELATKLGVAVIAEGVETLGEMQRCKSLGCQFGQGFFMGHPELTGPKLIATETVKA